MIKKNYKITIGIVFCALIFYFLFIYFHSTIKEKTGLVAITSISSEGNYALTTDNQHNAVLWDLKNKTKKIISTNANLYSAYWIKNTPYFMWQELHSGNVPIENAQTLKVIKKLKPWFLIFGQAMGSDLKYNVLGDSAWDIYVGKEHDAKMMVNSYDDVPGFEGGGKLINFTFLGNDKLLTSGLAAGHAEDPKDISGIYLWDLNTRKPIHDYIGNVAKTFATVSPDGKYVVSIDENGWQYVWETNTGKRVVQILAGDPILKRLHPEIIVDQHTIPRPKDLYGYDAHGMSVKFIDATHYLRFNTMSHYAVLYDVLDPKPLKYLDLGEKPYVETWSYERDQSLDTSPSANILVMAKQEEPGILVYHYDPNTQTLTKIWDAK